MKRFPAVVLICALNFGAVPAFAQQTQQQMPMMDTGGGQGMMAQKGMGMMGAGGMGMMGPGMQGMMDFGPMMEGRLAYTKAELGITDAQTAAWDDYTKVVKARATAMQTVRASMMEAMQAGSAVARLDARIKAMESMLASLKALKPATEALYSTLIDEQKKKADLLLGIGMM
ncbi:MAG: Spy/CpxP family protein refolding chaperone [Proteobacteria bacterium]|nr:Spy/CpxP family protein refolding chaperone [Pseudomonadota bacterium]